MALTTRNRAERLAQTLRNLEAVDVPAPVEWELLVVDNASTDETPAVLQRDWSLPLRALREERDGKSHAANLATERARGALLVWTDDDVRPAPDWIGAYVAAAGRWPAATFLGGPVLPLFEAAPPPWLEAGLAEVGLAYALLDLGPEERPLRAGERANGPNFAVRLEAARAHPWNPELGPRANGRISGGESWVQERIERAGGSGVWVPGARVEHVIPAKTMTLDYVRFRYRLHGRSLMRGRRSVAGAARSLLSLLLESYPRYLIARALGAPPRRWLRQYRRAATHAGKVSGLFAG